VRKEVSSKIPQLLSSAIEKVEFQWYIFSNNNNNNYNNNNNNNNDKI
jgi:hypothetical protein